MSDNLPTYNFETATESERWAYDQGFEAALDPTRMDIDDIQHAMEVCVEALDRIIAEQNALRVDSTTRTCPGCGVTVVGHDRCGDPTRPECAGPGHDEGRPYDPRD